MDRESFNLLSMDKQVEFFNRELIKDNFNSICKRIGVSKNTIKKRFENNNYEEKRQGQIIKKFIKKVVEEKKENIDPKKSILEKHEIHPVENIKPKENKNSDNKEIDLIFKRLKTLESEFINLKKSINNIDSNKNITDVIQYFEGETIVKTFKIDKEVNKKLEEIQGKFKGYKKQDIVSSLLKYALNNIE
ncbi:MAG: hypothetical protein ACRDDY_16100 [Clostridium sp.]|uniref:hypothetical protein n=1 Tax=Clostridium sp. TaxID=1506 RepID=UPI003EE61DAD